MVVVSGDVNNRNGTSSGFQATPHLDAGHIVQIDVQNDTKRLIEIAVILKCLCRLEQHAVIAMLSQQPFHTPQRARVVIHYKYGFSVRHDSITLVHQSSSNRHMPQEHVAIIILIVLSIDELGQSKMRRPIGYASCIGFSIVPWDNRDSNAADRLLNSSVGYSTYRPARPPVRPGTPARRAIRLASSPLPYGDEP